jgi:hypothetical protein
MAVKFKRFLPQAGHRWPVTRIIKPGDTIVTPARKPAPPPASEIAVVVAPYLHPDFLRVDNDITTAFVEGTYTASGGAVVPGAPSYYTNGVYRPLPYTLQASDVTAYAIEPLTAPGANPRTVSTAVEAVQPVQTVTILVAPRLNPDLVQVGMQIGLAFETGTYTWYVPGGNGDTLECIVDPPIFFVDDVEVPSTYIMQVGDLEAYAQELVTVAGA